MPSIIAQELSSPSEVPSRSSRSFVLLGLLIVAVLAVIDVAGGLIVGQAVAANISGTFALAPALTALSRSPRSTLIVGVPAVVVAAGLAVHDEVPWGTGLVRTLVVVVSAVLSTLVARAQERQWAQLQDRRQAARTLQAAMLTQLPRPQHLQLVSRYLPASRGDQVGGDWYDAVVDAGGATVLIIGDVVGHDIHAAAAMGQLRGLLRAYAVETGPHGEGQSPAQLLERVDEAIARLGLEVLATVVAVRVERHVDEAGRGVHRLRWSNAGHLPPMILLPPADSRPDADADQAGDATDADEVGDENTTTLGGGSVIATVSTSVSPGASTARVRRWRDEPDLLLGLGLTRLPRHDHVEELPVNSTLLLYTDGLIERRDQVLDEGLDRLAQAMVAGYHSGGHREVSLQRWVDDVLSATLQGAHQDDVAVLAVQAHPDTAHPDTAHPDTAGSAMAGSGRARSGRSALH